MKTRIGLAADNITFKIKKKNKQEAATTEG